VVHVLHRANPYASRKRIVGTNVLIQEIRMNADHFRTDLDIKYKSGKSSVSSTGNERIVVKTVNSLSHVECRLLGCGAMWILD
jgi:hypothetical protein